MASFVISSPLTGPTLMIKNHKLQSKKKKINTVHKKGQNSTSLRFDFFIWHCVLLEGEERISSQEREEI